MQQLSQQKDEMRGKVGQIEQQLDTIARDAQAANDRDAARKLQDAAGTIRDEMVKEKIEYSKQAMAGGSEVLEAHRERDQSNLDTLRQRIGEAAAATDKAAAGARTERARRTTCAICRAACSRWASR